MQTYSTSVLEARLPASPTGRTVALRGQYRPCQACGELSLHLLCEDCYERSRPHLQDDPYDDLGGESGSPQ